MKRDPSFNPSFGTGLLRTLTDMSLLAVTVPEAFARRMSKDVERFAQTSLAFIRTTTIKPRRQHRVRYYEEGRLNQ